MHGIAHLFTIVIIQPVFNLLVLIYSLLPGHNFGLAIILFTCLVRLLLWPLVKKQLYHTRKMQGLQPELKKIKKAAAGDHQKESRLIMELYKERGINPAASLGIMLLQLPILFALWRGVLKIVKDPNQLISFSYSWLHHLPWLQTLSGNIGRFDDSLFGAVNLTEKAITNGKIYWPALIIAAASAIAQYFQSKQLLPQDPNARSLKSILGEAGQGKSADQSEVNAAAQRTMIMFTPALIFIAALQFPAALPLYWLVNSLVAWWQQTIALNQDEKEAEKELDSIASEDDKPKAKRSKARSQKRRRAAAKHGRRRR